MLDRIVLIDQVSLAIHELADGFRRTVGRTALLGRLGPVDRIMCDPEALVTVGN